MKKRGCVQLCCTYPLFDQSNRNFPVASLSLPTIPFALFREVLTESEIWTTSMTRSAMFAVPCALSCAACAIPFRESVILLIEARSSSEIALK